MLEETYTDGFLVIQDGSVLRESYFNGMAASDTHLLMSVSKSINAALCGALGERGAVAPEDLVTDHVEQLRGSAWEGCTVQHLLDMRVGVRWDFDVDEYTILDVSGYRAHSRTDIPADTATWARTLALADEHGGPFGYCSLANDVLGWVLASAGGTPFPEQLSASLWSAIGAENDAEIIIDANGFPIVEGGICATLRDIGRFGLMWLQDGTLAGRTIVPGDWVATAARPRAGADRRVRGPEPTRRPDGRGVLPRQLVGLGRRARRPRSRRNERSKHLRAPAVADGHRKTLDVSRRARPGSLRAATHRHVGALRVARLSISRSRIGTCS